MELRKSITRNTSASQDTISTASAIAAYKTLHRLKYTKLIWQVANKIGINQALFVEVIEDWCQYNALHGKTHYFQDGEWWTAATYEQWAQIYPALGSKRSLQRLLLDLEKSNYVISAQCVVKSWNRTKFYRPNPETIGKLILEAVMAETTQNPIVPELALSEKSEGTQNGTIEGTQNGTFIYIEETKKDQIKLDHLSETNARAQESDTHTQSQSVEVEVLELEQPEASDRNSQAVPNLGDLDNNTYTVCNSLIDSLDQGSEAARDNNTKAPRFLVGQQRIDELEEAYGNGDNLGTYTQEELQALADRVMCDRIYLYRTKTRRILGQHCNDLDRGFLKFFAWRYWNDEQATKKAADTIRSYEKDPTKWQSLCLSVDEWQEFMSNPEKFKQAAIARANKKGGGSQVDHEIAAQTDADRFRKLQQQQAASSASVVDCSQNTASPVQGAPSPDSGNNQAKGTVERSPMPEDFKKQLEEMRQQQRSKPA